MKSTFHKMALILVVMGLLLAACGPAATDPTQPAAVATDPVPPGDPTAPPMAEGECPPSANGQTIEMWSPLTGPDGDEMSTLAQRYSSENPNDITVAHVAQPEYVQRLNASAAAGQLPAMTVVRVINVGELAARNVLQPYGPEAMAVLGANFGDEYPDNVWGPGEYNGQRYSIPLDIHTLVMYYNKDLFAAAGVEEPGTEPWTREEFESALEALHQGNVQAIAIGDQFQGATLFQTFIQQFGGALSNDAGTEATFNSAEGVRAMEYVRDLKAQYSPDISGGGDPEVNVFRQGNAAMVFHGPWHISDLQRLDFVGFAPLPQVGDEFAVWAGSHQLALTTADPAQQAAAACWIKWLSENSADWAAAGQIPARNSVRLSPDLASVAAPIAAIAPAADQAIILPQVPELEGALWGQFGPVVDGVLSGQTTDIQAALDQAAAQSQQIIDENAERY